MKKYLLALGLLTILAQPGFAQNALSGSCAPRLQVVPAPVIIPSGGQQQLVAPAQIQTGGACPVASSPCQLTPDTNYCNPCHKRGFWSNFFSF